jgi:hypothetical protein
MSKDSVIGIFLISSGYDGQIADVISPLSLLGETIFHFHYFMDCLPTECFATQTLQRFTDGLAALLNGPSGTLYLQAVGLFLEPLITVFPIDYRLFPVFQPWATRSATTLKRL